MSNQFSVASGTSDVPPPLVTITMTKAAAERIEHGLSDFLCWARGFKAAIPDEPERWPMGTDEARNIREWLNKALEGQGR